MAQSELPANVEHFLSEHIRSIEQLEILLLLREKPEQCRTAADVYRIVRSSERSVTETLERLCQQGLLRRLEGTAPDYQFSPPNERLRQTVDSLARLYAERRVKIIQAIYSDRVSEVDEFAKAFRLRKDPNA